MGVNKAILVGNLGADPELRYTANQTAVCTLRLATTERRKGKDGQWADHTEWHRVIVFGKTAENVAQYTAKGRQIYVEGRIQTNKWQDKEGKDRYTTEIIAETVQFLGGRGAEGGAGSSRSSGKPDMSESQVQMVANGGPVAPAGGGAEEPEVSFEDDDIPF